MIHELDIEYPRFAEPRCWECDNCKALWADERLVETWKCSDEICINFTCECPGCRKKCFSCDRDFCDQHLTSHDYGDDSQSSQGFVTPFITGPAVACAIKDRPSTKYYCAGCVADASENLPRCTSCGLPRCDVDELEDSYGSTGYHAIERYCGPCSNQRLRQFLTELGTPWTSDADVAF